MFFENGKPVETDSLRAGQDDRVLCLAAQCERAAVLKLLGMPMTQQAVEDIGLESHADVDYMSVHTLDWNNGACPAGRVEIYFAQDRLAFFYDRPETIGFFLHALKEEKTDKAALGEMLYLFFSKLTEGDARGLVNLEEEIADLEDDVAEDVNMSYPAVVSALRKKLLRLKRYYESLVALLEDLEENRNRILTEEQLRLFHFQKNRVARLFQGVQSLRDYVTQVREAYQAQFDIDQNKVMKLFTVITTIFLPLTLIAGWYGMNLKMPEFASPYAYAVVIAVSVLVVILSIVFFRKRKWF